MDHMNYKEATVFVFFAVFAKQNGKKGHFSVIRVEAASISNAGIFGEPKAPNKFR